MRAKGYRAAVEYIAMNDEPRILSADDMAGYPSVQVIAIAFGKTIEQVAEAVIKAREKAADGPPCPACGQTDLCVCE